MGGTSAQRTNFSDAELRGTDLRNADLRAASFHNAVVCGPNHDRDGGSYQDREGCIDLRDAHLQDADLRGVRYCDRDQTNCRPVSASELRDIAHADLAGAHYDQ
jgi:uncharacterized protein YjbI with pentapeptide repeats